MKTAQEWEQEFDILYNSINSNVAPALDSYEKSVLLTMAQEQVVKALYNGSNGNGFESTEALRRSLNNLIVEYKINRCGFEKNIDLKSLLGNYIYVLPDDILYIIAETAIKDGKEMIVVPTTHDEYYKTKNNPFKGPSTTRILKLDSGLQTTLSTLDTSGKGLHIELIGSNENTLYICRYIKKPYPIILEDLSDTTDYVNGKQIPHDNICELDESIHREILTTAVSLAQSTYLTNSK